MMISAPFIYYRSTSNSGSIFSYSCQCCHFYIGKFAICIILCIKAPLPQFNRPTSSVYIPHMRLIQIIRLYMYIIAQSRILSCSVLSLFVCERKSYFIVVAAVIWCVREGFSINVPTKYISGWYAEILFSLNLYFHMFYWHGFSSQWLSLPEHCHSHMRWSWMLTIYSVVCLFRLFAAPLICLIRKNNTERTSILRLCVSWNFVKQSLILK